MSNIIHQYIIFHYEYITNIEHASAITELSFIVNASYKESNNVVYDYEWKHYNFLELKKHNEKGIDQCFVICLF